MENQNPIKVLFVSCAGPPKGSPESLQVSKYLKYLLKQGGLSLTLITERIPQRNFGWRTLEQEYQQVLEKLHQVIAVPVYYHRLVFSLWKKVSPATFYRPDNEALFVRSFKKVIRSLSDKPEIIYSRSTPFSSAVLALRLKRHFQVPWVMHLSDPWVESPHIQVPLKYMDYHQHMENDCFTMADCLSFTNEETKQLYEAKYPHHRHKMRCFPNVFDDDAINPLTSAGKQKIRIVHTGNFYGVGRRPGPILKAIQRLEKNYPDFAQTIEVLFTGFQLQQAQTDFESYPCNSVKHLGVISLPEVTQLQRSADLLVLIDWELPQEEAVFQLSKTMDYLAARKPILAITTKGSTVHKMVEGQHGKCLEHKDHQGIYEALEILIDQGRSCPLLQSAGPLDRQYAASVNAEKLKVLFQKMAQRSPSSVSL